MDEKHERAYQLCLSTSKVALDQKLALATIAEGISSIETGIRLIGSDLPIKSMGAINLIAADSQCRPIFIGMSKTLDAFELCRALARTDWAIENLELIERLCSRKLVPETRTWLFAFEITPEIASLLSRMGSKAPEVFTCEGLDLDKDVWLVVRKFMPKDMSQNQRLITDETPKGSKGLHSVLSKEEIDDFFDVSGYGEEVTFGGN